MAANLYLGNITLKIEGTFNRAADGTWTLSANAKGFQDTYDFKRQYSPDKSSGTAHHCRALSAIANWWKYAVPYKY